jgi:hypothetical protein
MSIPLDRLYHYIENLAAKAYGDSVNIYRFFPYGSKNINDLNPLRSFPDWFSYMTKPGIWCNDQEPLAFDFYSQNLRIKNSEFISTCKPLGVYRTPRNLNWSPNIFKKNLLLHSEKRSRNVEKYLADNELIPVYYWSHALIARDWFRYAKYENFKKNIRKQFLIYNRSWTGTREYRLRFSDLLIEHGLADQCLTFCNPIENDIHYQNYTFANSKWRPSHNLEHYLKTTIIDASASADFCGEDYQSTNVEVVLETLFDDNRLHLTEKSLRPIACRQPFILVATHGSLQYLRDYGFQTFDTVWDESYDMIQDPYERMRAIIDVMCDILSWSDSQRLGNAQRMEQIINHNQKHFFSKEFSDQIIDELQKNMRAAFNQIKTEPGFDEWINFWQRLLQFPEVQEFMTRKEEDSFLPNTKPNEIQYKRILEFIDQYSLNQLQ